MIASISDAPALTAQGLGLGIDPARIAAARRTLDRSGTNISEWANRNGFSVKLVHAILQGRRRCGRGQSHRIAILLGLKDGELDDIARRGGGSPVATGKTR